MHKCLKKNNSYVCKLLSPCHGPKKTCGVGGHPTRSGVNNLFQLTRIDQMPNKIEQEFNHSGPSSDWQEQKLRSVQSQELRPCEAGCATPAAHRRPANTQHSGGEVLRNCAGCFFKKAFNEFGNTTKKTNLHFRS